MEHRRADGGDLYQRCLLYWRNPHTAKTESEIDRQTARERERERGKKSERQKEKEKQ